MKAKRLFAGIKLEPKDALRALATDLQRELRGERIRWVRLENMHLTVEFFGETAEDRIPEIDRALAQAATATPAFAMALGGLGTFGGTRQPRVLWLGVQSDGLQTLHANTAAALREHGWQPETRPYAPHLTLGRIERLRNIRAFAAVVGRPRSPAIPRPSVRELILFESVDGRYVPLGRWPLGP